MIARLLRRSFKLRSQRHVAGLNPSPATRSRINTAGRSFDARDVSLIHPVILPIKKPSSWYGAADLIIGSQVRALVRPPPSHRDRTPVSFFALMPPERGLFESQRVSVSVSEGGTRVFTLPSLHRKIPFLTRNQRPGSMTTAWGVGSSVPSVSASKSLISR